MNKASIDYKILRKINPEAARAAVLAYLATNGGNISDAAKMFRVQRLTVYGILEKDRQGSLKDLSKAPIRVANKTPNHLEQKVLEIKRQTGYGAIRISKIILKKYKIKIAPGTVKGIIKRLF